MGFNNAREMRKFINEQKRLAAEYTRAGMSEEMKDSLYGFDLAWYHSRRVYAEHHVQLPETEYMEEKGYSSLHRKFSAMSVTPNFEEDLEYFDWLDTIENEDLYRKLRALTDTDLKLLTLIVKDGYTQREAARELACSEAAISRRLKKIKKKLLRG